eukprot:scaffold140513_cov39-Tisochrysis_lutea.AAC.2
MSSLASPRCWQCIAYVQLLAIHRWCPMGVRLLYITWEGARSVRMVDGRQWERLHLHFCLRAHPMRCMHRNACGTTRVTDPDILSKYKTVVGIAAFLSVHIFICFDANIGMVVDR